MVGGGVAPQEGTSHPLVPPRCSHLPPGSCSRNVRVPAASGGEDEAAPAPLLPSVPRGPGDPVPRPGDTSQRGRAEPGRGAVGSGSEPRARRSCAAAPLRGMRGWGRQRGSISAGVASRGWHRALRHRLPGGALAPRTPGRGRGGSGRRHGGEAKCEISHLPRGGRRLREAASRRRQLPPSLCQCQRRAWCRGDGTRWPGRDGAAGRAGRSSAAAWGRAAGRAGCSVPCAVHPSSALDFRGLLPPWEEAPLHLARVHPGGKGCV